MPKKKWLVSWQGTQILDMLATWIFFFSCVFVLLLLVLGGFFSEREREREGLHRHRDIGAFAMFHFCPWCSSPPVSQLFFGRKQPNGHKMFAISLQTQPGKCRLAEPQRCWHSRELAGSSLHNSPVTDTRWVTVCSATHSHRSSALSHQQRPVQAHGNTLAGKDL